MTQPLVSPIAAARLAGISKSSIRNYVRHGSYGGLFAPDARRVPRLFTVDDVRLLRFIGQQTAQGRTHDQIAEAIAAGALKAFDWQPPVQEATAPTQEAAQPTQPTQEAAQTAAIVLVGRQLEFARTREEELIQQLGDAREEIGRLKAELEAARQPFWRRLFGR